MDSELSSYHCCSRLCLNCEEVQFFSYKRDSILAKGDIRKQKCFRYNLSSSKIDLVIVIAWHAREKDQQAATV